MAWLIDFIKSSAAKYALAAITAVLCLVMLHRAYIAVYDKGYAAAHAAVMADWQAERAELLRQNQVLTAQVLNSQINLITQGITLTQHSQEQINHVNEENERRLAAVRASALRVYIRAKTVPASLEPAGAATARAPGAPGSAQRCELDPEVVAALSGIARDGDIAIIERNELIARYQAARSALQQLEQQRNQTPPQQGGTP